MNMHNETLFYTANSTSREEKGIYVCALNGNDGSMRIVSTIAGIASCSYLTLNSAGDRLYAVSEVSEGEVLVYSVDKKTGELHQIDRKPTEGADPCYISLSKDEKFVFVSNYSGGQVNVFRLGNDGTLDEMSSLVVHTGSSIDPERQEAAHPHSVFADTSGQYVMVCDLGLDQIVIYRLEDGILVTHHEVDLPPGSGPRHFDFHPDKKWGYVVNELNNTITVCAYNETSADLRILQSISSLPSDYQGISYVSDIHISACGRFLYVSNRGFDSIGLFLIDPDTGGLEAVEWVSTRGVTPRNFAISPSGHIIVANQNSANVISFSVDSDTGCLTETGFNLQIPKPMCIQPV
ncbi:lactonase family protein [Paenibacillus sp. IHBB 10380]|uniref:lactonase family protein n=1 Tax=Paenibacillus sp. IHBB 10380 TaxID=1566358 RepID=UPI0005CF9858|nr:lactonase family protein [Paenibacillus sp. IHBB 10380]AJS61017.1 6-phosphogluconolactonase [Paenibacillus sp. IHBB 10380]